MPRGPGSPIALLVTAGRLPCGTQLDITGQSTGPLSFACSPSSGVTAVWMPHSVLSQPRQRPARGSSPGFTMLVQGAQPIEG